MLPFLLHERLRGVYAENYGTLFSKYASVSRTSRAIFIVARGRAIMCHPT